MMRHGAVALDLGPALGHIFDNGKGGGSQWES